MLLLEIILAVAVRRSLDAVEVVRSLSLMELAQPPTFLDMTVARIKYWHSTGKHYSQLRLICHERESFD